VQGKYHVRACSVLTAGPILDDGIFANAVGASGLEHRWWKYECWAPGEICPRFAIFSI